MSITLEVPPYGTPYGERYDPDMPKTKTMGVEALRKVLGQELEKAAEEGTHIFATKHGIDRGVFVPMDWYRRAREALKEPTDR
ncbi:hypothetical protein [Paractinoplanes toevensis]|uniref:Antitoxin n=1 Tax=Paractinoplanes toevensis TaxID=571911 RepID=A0A919T555_9ACTN|nr:hypothetical protein [Actinoplanes toevensis]GIM88852.1 hypothetical protein Ato02nite_006450 [Actinoplanes toevensis]